ncbi:hypothetical protein HK105_204245 [Polyrhizophydium stewartii]|uniref:Pyridoxal phosphate homeostasis protein n=1 Tax=Polyrhizophydium stewartii TaxID=2732419 RepID=A0ABR4N9M3_9FUNG
MSTPAVAVDPLRKQDIAANLAEIAGRVAAAVAARGDPSVQTRLVAVSKTKPASDIAAAYELGHRHFGENIQELVEKAAVLPKDIHWHFIGKRTLQSNKCKALASVPNLWVVETIDSAKKAVAMNKACEGREEPLSVFLQVNTSGEESKSGIAASECVAVATEIVQTCTKLRLKGLMTIGAAHNVHDGVNPDFELLVNCRKQIAEALGLNDLELSMGMSDDFEAAIKYGSTNVRVGSSIFGARSYPPKN